MNNFVNRLELLLQHYELNASAFADKIGVQRSSLSHILSGRNKASLDFILKINEAFNEVKIEWLIKGIGAPFSNVQNDENTTSAPTLEFNKNTLNVPSDSKNSGIEKKETPISSTSINDAFLTTDDVQQIVVFYKDGTFSTYKPR